jgi:peptidoglycan hydrolase-like protein with peptidoglycan-binding domain
MILFRRRSQGPEVIQIQSRLKALEHYLGPIDGDFSGGTVHGTVYNLQEQYGIRLQPFR